MSAIFHTFAAHKDAIKRFLVRQGAREHELDDFTQEIFLRAFAAELGREIEQPKPYLFQIARNLMNERFRHGSRNPVDLIEDTAGADTITDYAAASPEDLFDARRKLALFAEAVASLPPQCRNAFLMRRIEGLKYKQIANRMNISVSAVEKHVVLGLVKCKAFLEARGYHPGEFGAAAKSAGEVKFSNGRIRPDREMSAPGKNDKED